MSRQQIDLPPHVYTRQNLAESGIRFPPPVLDTAARNGPSLTARITAVLAVLTLGASCYTGFSEGAVTVIRIAGFLLCLRRGASVRVLTLWTRPDCRNGAASVPLLRSLCQAARRAGVGEIDAARIPADNPRSLALARALGGREIARYRIYRLDGL